MDDELQPKITVTETFAVIGSLALLDIVDILLLFVGMDDFFIIDALAFPVTQLYFRMKGVRANYMLTSNLLELVPYVGKLPMRSIGAAITIRAANKPEGLVAGAVSLGSAAVRKKLQASNEAGGGKTKGGGGAEQKLQDFETLRRKAAIERGVARQEAALNKENSDVVRSPFEEG